MMFLIKKRLSLLSTIVSLVVLVITACGGGTAATPVPSTPVAKATATHTTIPTHTATPTPMVFSNLPEVGIDPNGGVTTFPSLSEEGNDWPSKVLVSSTSIYAWLKCQGQKSVEVYATLELSAELVNFPLLSHPDCQSGLLLIVSGKQTTYSLNWGENGTFIEGEAYIDGKAYIDVMKFNASAGTEVNIIVNSEPEPQ